MVIIKATIREQNDKEDSDKLASGVILPFLPIINTMNQLK